MLDSQDCPIAAHTVDQTGSHIGDTLEQVIDDAETDVDELINNKGGAESRCGCRRWEARCCWYRQAALGIPKGKKARSAKQAEKAARARRNSKRRRPKDNAINSKAD